MAVRKIKDNELMNVLILEDSINRIKYFIEKFSDHNLVITENAHEAIIYLNEQVFDCIFLDHDLGPNNGCGADVAAYLCDNIDNENNDAMVVIHSWNVPAANSMHNELPNSKLLPFGTAGFFEVNGE